MGHNVNTCWVLMNNNNEHLHTLTISPNYVLQIEVNKCDMNV